MPAKTYLHISSPNSKTISQTSNKSVDNIAMFPVGIAYISAIMTREGFDAHTLNGGFAGPYFEQHLTTLFHYGRGGDHIRSGFHSVTNIYFPMLKSTNEGYVCTFEKI